MSDAEGRPSPVSATVVIAQSVRPGREKEHLLWQAEVTDRCRRFPGFEAAEFVPPVPGFQDECVVVFRFDSFDHLDAWLRSDVRRELLERGRDLFAGDARPHVVANVRPAARGAGMVVSTRVKAGHEAAYQEWQRRISAETARFPGFSGTEVFPAVPGVQDEWVVVVRFDSAEHLEDWLSSEARRRLDDEAARLRDETRVDRVRSGFPGWFTAGEPAGGRRTLPPAWKQAMCVLLVLYPTVMLLSRFFSPLLRGLPVAISSFVSNAVSVTLLGWLLMPLVNRALGFWLTPSTAGPRVEAFGVGAVLLGYALAVTVFAALF